MGRVACETAVTTGLVLVMGEITSSADVDIHAIVRDTLLRIGYTDAEYGIDGANCAVLVSLDQQSPDIAMGVDRALESRLNPDDGDLHSSVGAGDQGLMFGFASNETPELMPLPISLAHRLAQRLAKVRHDGTLPYLRPDGKTQVTVEYDGYRPVRVDTVVVVPARTRRRSTDDIRRRRAARRPTGHRRRTDGRCDVRIYVNPTGRFVVGGPRGDSGLTGRKIIVDTYGGAARHGGGRSREKIRRRWTVQRVARHVTWRSTSWPRICGPVRGPSSVCDWGGPSGFRHGRHVRYRPPERRGARPGGARNL